MITYDGVELPDAGIKSIAKTGGAYTWQFDCHTDDYTKITALMAYAAPVQVQYDLAGQQYVVSAKLAKTLVIAGTSYTNCYLQGPIQAAPAIMTALREDYHFSVTIVQSTYTGA